MDERDEQATFEARAVLAPRRALVARLAFLLPVIALATVAWAGASGPRSDQTTAEVSVATAVVPPSPSASPRPEPPAEVLGLAVHRLGDLEPRRYGRGDVLAIAGWYAPTAITDCPALPALYRDGALPYVRGDNDKLAFCVRSGVLYAAKPGTSIQDRRSRAGLAAVNATVVTGVIMPIDLELTDAGATEVVVLGHFVPASDACHVAGGCGQALIVDYLGWTPETPAT